ncbi:unnamed protein product [Lactuca virosa]|uniref:DYW domain-containing protein n=1 Tax=Lactuca virosa TaxID=75947 RepID=A0AAU9LYV8_9ASTR|nr:unnamed protein product [Lactuca virosa]
MEVSNLCQILYSIKQGSVNRGGFIVMSVLMRPTLFPSLFRQQNGKLLRYIGGTKNLEFSKVIQSRFIVSDQCSRDDTPEINALINLYSKCEPLKSASHALMSGNFQNGSDFEVVRLFKSMISDHNDSCLPNEYISGLVISSCLNIKYLSLSRQCHGYLFKSGLVFNQYVKTALVRLYSMLSDVVGAMEALLSNPGLQLNTCSYNHILVGLIEKGYLDEALIISRRMLAEEDMVWKWNKATYIVIFGLCARLVDLDLGRQVHIKLLNSDVEFDESVCRAMINMYAKCGEILSARKVFDMFEPRNTDIYTEMLVAYSEHESFEKSFEKSFELFFKMQYEDVVQNESTFSLLLTVSAQLSSMRCGKMLHALTEKTGFNGHKIVEDALINMYSKTGDTKAAEKVFLDMTNYRDIVTWNMMICGYCYHGLGNESLALFQEMLEFGEDPNCETFVGVLSACGHVGLVEEGFYYLYELMKQKALSFILSTPSKWDIFAWTTLLSACRAHQNYTLGIRVAELIPDDVANKVCKCCGVTEVGELMDIKEERGGGWMETDNETFSLVSVDNGDPGFIEIHEFMKQLFADIKIRPDQDGMKGDNIDGYHCEELGLAYALSTTDKMIPIHIIKDSGKISNDCHNLMKLISSSEDRLIMVRDAYQFHTFQDGRCSCADYW